MKIDYYDMTLSHVTIIGIVFNFLVDGSHGLNSQCDHEKYPETGCDRSLMTVCDAATKKCICKSGYPIEVNGRCFEYKSVGDECITSSQCYKAKCVDIVTGDEIISENGVENTRKGVCKCTDDRFLDTVSRECAQRFVFKRCFFNYECFRPNSNCYQARCTCNRGYIYDTSSDSCLPNPLGLCWGGMLTENGTIKCQPFPRGDPRYPHFRRPSYVNFMWPVFAFVLVILMFKLLKEGLERECPVPSGTSCAASPLDQIPGTLMNSSRRSRLSHSNHRNLSLTTSNMMANRVNVNVDPPPVDTVVAMPPPYDSQDIVPSQVLPNEQPPSYEEAVRTAPIK